MLDFVFLVFLGLGISTVLVRRSSRKGMDLELTWLQSLKVVLVRGAVALGLGFGIGAGIQRRLHAPDFCAGGAEVGSPWWRIWPRGLWF